MFIKDQSYLTANEYKHGASIKINKDIMRLGTLCTSDRPASCLGQADQDAL